MNQQYRPRAALDLSRTVVIGTSGSGKTSFAKRLAGEFQVPQIELDALNWMGNWAPRAAEDFRFLVNQASAQPRWVADGNYGTVRDILWPRATAVIWLNYSHPLVLSRALRRTLWRCATRERLCGDNRETFAKAFLTKESILWWVMTSYRDRQREFRSLFDGDAFPELTKIEFQHPDQAARALQDWTGRR